MPAYLMLFRNEKNDNVPTAEQMNAVMQQWQTWIKSIAASGKFLGTNRLFAAEAKCIDFNNVVTDGPYIEAKEFIGGYVMVEAISLDEATEIAKACPNLKYGGKVEVRSVIPIEYNPETPNFLEKI